MEANCLILIVNWNSWQLLLRCLLALQKQSYKKFNVLVADNASIEPPPKSIFTLFPDLIFIQNNHNYGFANANNKLLRIAINSNWVIFLNPDAFPQPNWLECLLRTAKKNPEYSMFASRMLMDKDPAILDGDGDSYHISGLAWRKGHGNYADKSVAPKEIFSPCAAAAMYRTKELLAVGGFDEDYFCYFEDIDLGFRMRLRGQKCLLVPTAIVNHIGSATTGGQQSDFSVYHGHRNLVWTYIKNMPGLLFWVFLPYHLLLNIVSVALFVARGKGNVILRAKWDAIKGISAMWRKRKVIQSNRSAPIRDIWRVMDKSIIPWIRHY